MLKLLRDLQCKFFGHAWRGDIVNGWVVCVRCERATCLYKELGK